MNRPSVAVDERIRKVHRALKTNPNLSEACRGVEWNTFRYYQAVNKRPWAQAERVEILGTKPKQATKVPGFVEFRKLYFGHDTPWHQMEWWKAIEKQEKTLILQPPGHGKTTFMEEYILWRVCQDRNVKVLLICESQEVAEARLWRIGQLLSEESEYEETERNLVKDFGPFKSPRSNARYPWKRDKIYVIGADTSGRDPTVQAGGVGTAIQGNRTDIAVLDDTFTVKNQFSQTERTKQMMWLTQTVMSRDRPRRPMRMIVVGTRAHATDNYARLLTHSAFTSLVHRAILDDEKQQTLWPEEWPYAQILQKREEFTEAGNEAGFLLTYQQQATDLPDATFPLKILDEAKDPAPDYLPGMPKNRGNVRVMGVDPAYTGTCAIVVLEFDPVTRQRYVLDVVAKAGLRNWDNLKYLVISTASKWRVQEARVERNAMQGGTFRERDIIAQLASIGCRLTSEFTSQHNKFDHEAGLRMVGAAIAAGLYTFPDNVYTRPWLDAFVAELSAWRPELGRKQTQDRVMALWLADLSAQELARFAGPKPPPDPGVSKRTQRSAYEMNRRGVKSLKERLHAG